MAQGGDHKQIKRKLDSSDACTMTKLSKRRKSRWGPESMASRLTGLKTAITAPMTSEQVEAYALHVRIEEITQKLRIDDIVPADDRRSPSPEPQYDASGICVNIRYRRHRERLEDERYSLIQVATHIIPSYRAPQGYVNNRGRIKEKVYIPAKDFPEANFIGQLLGPRGCSLTDMNNKSGPTIVIRGKGSVKEGRSRPHNETDHHQEPLCCLITADAREKVDKAKALVQAVIETVATTPEHANDRKHQQLRYLAMMNGTFRDDEGHGGGGWKRPRVAANVVCRVCSNDGHIARDCPDRKAAGISGQSLIPPWRQANRGQGGAGDAVDLSVLHFLSEMKTNS
ncbi:hypothetical protein GJ744_011825 [Endocarpon pusillum]|uniref:Branchpoint-bridging protein n=1 Tax=Endocarpon pusillum TaxID=364733 RepID=A0A8H7AF92_9EURO|nr:hypothetical protein GJ744_011825 [Endocarpon pusillum]